MGTRNLTAAMLAAVVAGGTFRPAIFYEGEYVAAGSPSNSPEWLRFWSGYGSYQWNGYTWTGGGRMLSFGKLEETRDLRAVGFTVKLTGLRSDLVAIALSQIRQNRPGNLWLGLFDSAGALLADPYLLQSGLLDIVVLEDNGETATIAVQYEGELVDLEKPAVRFYTPEEQKIDYPADEGFSGVAALQGGVEVSWD